MIRLTDMLAQRRILYTRPIATLPDIMILDISAAFAGPTLPLGHYYPIVLETEAELRELEVRPDQRSSSPNCSIASLQRFAPARSRSRIMPRPIRDGPTSFCAIGRAPIPSSHHRPTCSPAAAIQWSC